MPITQNISDEELDMLVAQKMASESQVQAAPMQPAPMQQPQNDLNALTDDELDSMVAQKMAGEAAMPAQQEFQPEREADLGAALRAQYSIEPLATNRKLLLERELGKENVIQDQSGELFVRQNGAIRPVNAPGISTADVAEFGGAIPEMLGAGAGTALGLGAASIPGAVAGGLAGSAIRQGASALLGTPQEATIGERAVETGLSGALGGAGAGLGRVAKASLKKMAPAFGKIFKGFKTGKEGEALKAIAKKEGLPSPTVGQLAGGRDLEVEKLLAQRPVFGRGIRKQTDTQIKSIKKNLAKSFGEFAEVETKRGEVGLGIKDLADNVIEETKKQASEKYTKIAEQARDIVVDPLEFKASVLEGIDNLRLFDPNGNPLKHTSRTGLTADKFKRLQDVVGSVLEDIDQTAATGELGVGTIDTMRKFIQDNISEGKIQGFDNVNLIKLREAFLDTTEDLLEQKDIGLKNEFKQARSLWKKQLDLSTLFESGGRKGLGIKDMSEEKVLKHAFSNKKNVVALKELIGEDATKDAGTSFINDMLIKRLGGEDQIGAGAALNLIKEKRESIIEAVGRESYNKLKDNLFFLEKIGRPVNPSKTFVSEIMQDITPGGLASGLGQQAVRQTRKITKGAVKGVESLAKDLPRKAAMASIVLSRGEREKIVTSIGQSANADAIINGALQGNLNEVLRDKNISKGFLRKTLKSLEKSNIEGANLNRVKSRLRKELRRK